MVVVVVEEGGYFNTGLQHTLLSAHINGVRVHCPHRMERNVFNCWCSLKKKNPRKET